MQENDLTCKETTKSQLNKLTQFVPNDVRQIAFKMADEDKKVFDIYLLTNNLWRIWFSTKSGVIQHCDVLACEDDQYEIEQDLDTNLDEKEGLESHDVMDIMEVVSI